MIEAVFTVIAVTLNIIFVWPQALHVLHARTVHGVSPATWTISIALFTGWTVYATDIGYWALAAANASCLVAAVIILTVGIQHGWSRAYPTAASISIPVILLANHVQPVILIAALIAGGIALRVPQLVHILRDTDTSDISAMTWVLSGATSAAWLVVSLQRDAFSVAIANVTAIAVTVVLLVVLKWARSRRTI